MTKSDDKRVAVFIDFENINISLGELALMIDTERYNIFREVGENYGKVVMIKPYACWDFMYPQQKAFEEIGIRTVPIFSSLKNATDITLVIDCMSSAFKDNVDTFVIFAGDGGYAPLVNYLIDELDKEVILLSVKESTKGKVYQRLGENHKLINDELKDVIVSNSGLEITPDLVKLVEILHQGLKKLEFMARRYFFNYICKHDYFKKFESDECGKLIDNAISLRLINSGFKENPNTTNNTRILLVNYEHPKVIELNLK